MYKQPAILHGISISINIIITKFKMEDRKARLKALAAKAGRAKPAASNNDDDEAEQQQQVPEEEENAGDNNKRPVKFRNYTPADEELQNAEAEETEEPSSKRAKTSDDKPKSKLEEALEKTKQEVQAGTTTTATSKEDATLTAMAPKKINWDLKRDIQPKLDKLEKRTQKAIVQLLRERLAREADEAAAQDDDNGSKEEEEDQGDELD